MGLVGPRNAVMQQALMLARWLGLLAAKKSYLRSSKILGVALLRSTIAHSTTALLSVVIGHASQLSMRPAKDFTHEHSCTLGPLVQLLAMPPGRGPPKASWDLEQDFSQECGYMLATLSSWMVGLSGTSAGSR